MSAPTQPGVYAGVPDSVYHRDKGSLSSSQARRLLEVSPRRWHWERDHPKAPSDAFDLGHVVHTLVLGVGAQPVDSEFEEWRAKAAKDRVAEIRASGGIPLKPGDYRRAHAMADSLRAHEDIAALLSSGQPELSVYHHDTESGLLLRTRPDWTHWTSPSTAIVVDVKTSGEPDPDAFAWSAGKFGYYQQEAWYCDGYQALGVECRFLFAVVCTEPPYEAYAVELPERARWLGRRRNRRAIGIYTGCLTTGQWPGVPGGIHQIDLPEKYYRREEYLSDY